MQQFTRLKGATGTNGATDLREGILSVGSPGCRTRVRGEAGGWDVREYRIIVGNN